MIKNIFITIIVLNLFIGLQSIFYFFNMVVFNSNQYFLIIELPLIFLFLFYLYKQNKFKLKTLKHRPLKTIEKVVFCVFYLILGLKIISFLIYSLNNEYGYWDAIAIWNMKAHFLYSYSGEWTDIFLVDTHKDYPLLLSITIASFWKLIGSTTSFVPIFIAFNFYFSTVLLLTTYLVIYKNYTLGFISGILLMLSDNFFRVGYIQYADVPLSFFYLVTLILLMLYSKDKNSFFLILAGLFLGFAAWTKNEGLPFLIFVPIIFYAVYKKKYSLSSIMLFFISLIPGFLTNLVYRFFFAPPNYLFNNNEISVFKKIFDFDRHYIILKHIFLELSNFDSIFILSTILFLIAFLGVDYETKKQDVWFVILVLLLLVSIYYFVYLITNMPLDWQLSTSLNRLIIQLFPLFIFFIIYFIKKDNLYAKT